MLGKEDYLTERQVAALTKRAVQTLRNDRFRGQGIPYIKLGQSVRYRYNDIIKFMEEGKIKTTRI